MNLTPQIKAAKKTALAQLERAKKNVEKTEKNLRAAAASHKEAEAEVATAKAEIAKCDAMLKLDEGSEPVAPKGKPGPKAAAPTKATAPAPSKKAAPAKKAASKQSQSRAAEGRREVLSGKRPPIKEVITKVLGKRVMSALAVYEAIMVKGQLPNSNDPKGYIGYLLSVGNPTIDPKTHEKIKLWESVPEAGRGFYRNRGVKTTKATPVKTDAAPKAKAAPKKAAKATPKKAPPKAKAAPKKAGTRQPQTCGVCGKTGHNKKGHDKAVAKAAAPAKATPAKKVAKAPKAKDAPKKAAPAKAPGEKKTVKCSKCGEAGHNSKGHDKFVAKTNGTKVAAKPRVTVVDKTQNNGSTEAKPEPAEAKPEPAKSTDEILKEAGIDLGPAIEG
jgi:hypothetical protein